MHKWEDYYKLLQIDFLADSDMIALAYKNLAKKHHPDVNKNVVSVEIMTKINAAYETLSHPDKRSQYDLKWLERHGTNRNRNFKEISSIDALIARQAKGVLQVYFDCLLTKDYETAYRYISENDKKYISKQDFIKWQETVAKVFQPTCFELETLKCYKRKVLKETTFDEVIEFNVTVSEKNLIMNRMEDDEFIKQMVFENNQWSVYIGYKKLTPHINKFERLSNLSHNKKRVLVKTNLKTDFITGFLNKKSLLEKIFLEIERYNRYGNIFSVLICKLSYPDDSNILKLGSNKHLIIKEVSDVISQSIRILDVPCRWSENTFIILLPETNLAATGIVIKKLRHKIKDRNSIHTNWYAAELVAIENTYRTTDELIESIQQYPC